MQGGRFKFAKSLKSLFSPELRICPLTNIGQRLMTLTCAVE